MIKSFALKLFILELIFFVSLTTCYIYAIVPFWGYLGFENNFSGINFIAGIILIIIISFLGLFLKEGFIRSVWHIILMYFLFPQTIYFFVSSGNIRPVIAHTILLLILYLVSMLKIPKIKGFNFNVEKSEKNFLLILLFAIFLTLPFLQYLPYVKLSNLLLIDIYDSRFIFRSLDRSSFLDYVMSPLSRVILPVLLIVAYQKRKWLFFIFIGVIISYLYLASGALKSIFFGMFMAIFFYFGKSFEFKIKLFAWTFIFLSSLSLIEYFILDTAFISDMTIRRLFFIPPYFEDLYYNYFSINDKTFYSHSFLKAILDPSNGISLSRELGYYFSGNEDLNANVGLIADGFLSLGWLGVILHSIIFSVLLKGVQGMEISSRFFGIFFVYIYYANTAFIGIFFFTHAFLFLYIFTYFVLRRRNSLNLTQEISHV